MSRVEPIPVVVVTAAGQLFGLDPDTALLRLPADSGHGHADGEHCLACASRTDVRAMLYDLLEASKRGMRPAFRRVVIDASAVPDPGVVLAALSGKLPAQALRDHTVARLFYLADAA